MVEKGNPSYFVNGTNVVLKEGEGIFINAKCPHYGYSENGEDSTYLCLVFSPSLLSASKEIADNYISPLRENTKLPFLIFPADKCARLKEDLDVMLKQIQEKKDGYQLKLLSGLYDFWAAFLSLQGQEKETKLDSSDKALLVKRMLSFIYNHYQEKIDVDSIAKAASISPGYASHLFTKMLHASPISYLLSFRIQKSGELLSDFTKDISEISSAVGFESPSYFSETFKKEKGCSPKEYRQLLKKDL